MLKKSIDLRVKINKRNITIVHDAKEDKCEKVIGLNVKSKSVK